MRDIRMLVRYSAWADSRLFSVLQTVPTEELIAPRITGLGSMLDVIGHCYIVDLIWKAHLEGRSHGFTSRIPQNRVPLDELRKNQTAVDQWYVDYTDSLTAAMHDDKLHFQFVDGGSGALTRGDMVLHSVNHKSGHRGYVAVLLYQSGIKPPVLDIPVFMLEQSHVL